MTMLFLSANVPTVLTIAHPATHVFLTGIGFDQGHRQDTREDPEQKKKN